LYLETQKQKEKARTRKAIRNAGFRELLAGIEPATLSLPRIRSVLLKSPNLRPAMPYD